MSGYKDMVDAIERLNPCEVSAEVVNSLTSMLSLPTFEPIKHVIEKKIIEIGDFLREIEKRKILEEEHLRQQQEEESAEAP
jgi:hypothetical protein